MAILKKPYELSLWKDVWDDTHQHFDEQKICVIGSNDMTSQGRAFDLTLKRNVNGSKKLTFKMYKKYIDTITGETIHNPFVDILVSESKIKLNYNGRWFDFIIKNIVESSSTHLCTYQLEDAFVNELSKNGFNKILSTELENNMGSIKDLANDLLDETDWRVGPTSEKIVQTVEDALVYVTIPQDTTIYPLIDQDKSDRTNGVKTGSAIILDEDILVLAFYTSCKNKPHRFQFIYQSGGYFNKDGKPSLSRDSERVINQANCQYYCEIDDPANYTVTQYNMSLPDGWLFSAPDQDELISTLYRGDRYGFAQQSKYIPEIDRYVYLYKKDDDDTVYYGYQYNQYTSATTVSDIITNSSFKGVAGWTGHTTERIVELDEDGNVKTDENRNPIKKDGVKKASVESVYGYFDEKEEFVSLIDVLQNGNDKPDDCQYLPYLKFSFKNNTNKKQIVFNSGPYDHRYSIKEMPEGSLWAIRCDNQNGESLISNDKLNFSLAEYVYNTDPYYLCYTDTENFKVELVKNEGVYETYTVDGVTYYFFKVTTNNYATETAFTKSSEVRLVITEKDADVTSEATDETTYYIKNIELFRAHYTKGETPKLLIPNENHVGDIVEDIKDQIIFSEYRYFSKDAVEGITDEKDLELAHRSENLTYETYKPVYNNEAEKIRSVEEKESNYFNILQSLAETFECWLDIEVERDDTGKIIRRTQEDTEGPMGTLKKNIVFKNFVGQKNHASFRYGVNLKDIQRTYESKNIVTKLIVKTNANEHAPNGFCTIQRAGANPTGENYLYDFSYYHNMGMLDPNTYLSIIQDSTDTDGEWKGPDCGDKDEINLKGYNIRISNLNKTIQEENEKLIGLAQDITKVSAQKKTAEAKLDAANAGIVEVEANYEKVAKQHITVKPTDELLKRDDIKSLLMEYGTYMGERDRQEVLVATYTKQYNTLKSDYAEIEKDVNDNLKLKKALNTKFYNTYSRFIQEGTWVDEEYIDDDKYYNDAKSVLYNSCYPQVAYNINVLALSMLPGYELLDFDLGDQTNVVDPEFFGEQFQEEVVVTETVESLDDPTKNTIKVQNFKNQFQDLFQKITATVQQTQYSTGAYQKAVSLAYAEEQTKMEFLNDALNSAGAILTAAGQQSVTWGENGITVTDVNTPCNEIRMIGGAILLSKQDEQTGQKKWVSAVTSEGISANLVTAGVINTGKVAIMNGNEVNFLWDANGINAFGDKTVKAGNSVERPFVRFDKYGLYGIKDKDGAVYRADSLDAIKRDATFALTWDGLKVMGDDGVEVNIGKQDDSIINITKEDSIGEAAPIFKVTNRGNLELYGVIHAGDGDIGGWNIGADGIAKDSVGLLSSDTYEYPALVTDGKSPIRFYVGELGEDESETEAQTITFQTDAIKPLEYTISAKRTIEKIEYVGEKNEGGKPQKTHLAEKKYLKVQSLTEGEKFSVIFDNISSPPNWANLGDVNYRAEAGAILVGAFESQPTFEISTTEGGNVRVTGTSPQTALGYIRLTITYTFVEELILEIEHEEDSSEATIKFTPKTSESYDLDFEYTTKGVKPKFAVLADGTLYAEAASISGEIEAEKGKVGGWSIDQTKIAKDAFCLSATDEIMLPSLVNKGDYSPIRIVQNFTESIETEVETRSFEEALGWVSEEDGVVGIGTSTLYWTEGDEAFFKVDLSKILGYGEAVKEITNIEISYYENVNQDDSSGELLQTFRTEDYKLENQTLNIFWKEKQYPNYPSDGAPSISFNYTVETFPLLNNSKFCILKDGSVYAGAINIVGSGRFDGELHAQQGTFNNLKCGGVLYDVGKDGVSRILVEGGNGQLKIGDEGSYFLFNPLKDVTDTKTIEITWYSYDIWSNTATIGGRACGYAKKTIKIYVCHRWGGKQEIFEQALEIENSEQDFQFTVIIEDKLFADDYIGISSNRQKAINQASTPAIGIRYSGSLSDMKDIISENYSGTIDAYGSILPLNSESRNLGSSKQPWNQIYCAEIHQGMSWKQDDSSDERIKNSIESLDERYEMFFNKIQPSRYKYNNGTSNRYHTGFVAQQLVSALIDSNLTTQDFAGVLLKDPDTEEECWYLRRDEFVSLNTWQIQKLKPRVTQLEEKIIFLEQRIAELEKN